MIEKMKFVSITGPREDIDRVVNNYLSRYEIHLENALTELTDVKNLSPYLEINPYKEALSTVGSFYEEVENPEQASAKKLPIEKALSSYSRSKMKRMSLTRPVRNWKRNVILWQNHFVSSILSEM
ncbi:MAG: hypothetical protein ACLTER_16385 [Ruminococcus sp.]